MTMSLNPYASPAAELAAPERPAGSEVADALVQLLARTKPWLRVVGVFMWISLALMVLGSAGMLLMGAVENPAMAKAGWGKAMTFGLALLYLVLAAVYVYPARRLWSFGSAIERLTHTRSQSDLQAALDAQRAFWTFVGISILALIAIYVLGFLGVVVAAVMSTGH
jgi:hypothetical protein